jgi:hypothetical protein
MTTEYEIVEVFEITGRGALVLIDEFTERSVGNLHKVEVLTPEGRVVRADAHKEYLLRRQPTPTETEGYLLTGVHKSAIPTGSRLRFVD